MIKIKFKKLHPDAKMPTKAYRGDACFDMYAVEDVKIYPRTSYQARAGFATEIPEGYAITYRARSSQGKNRIQVHGGTLDSGYRGEHGVFIFNHNLNRTWEVKKGDKICQMFIDKVLDVEFEEVGELGKSERGEKGFGSSGK